MGGLRSEQTRQLAIRAYIPRQDPGMRMSYVLLFVFVTLALKFSSPHSPITLPEFRGRKLYYIAVICM